LPRLTIEPALTKDDLDAFLVLVVIESEVCGSNVHHVVLTYGRTSLIIAGTLTLRRSAAWL
jgi:hypothetical protein